VQSLNAGGPAKSVDVLGIFGHGDGAGMAERDHIGIGTFWRRRLARSFFQDRCGGHPDGPLGGWRTNGRRRHRLHLRPWLKLHRRPRHNTLQGCESRAKRTKLHRCTAGSVSLTNAWVHFKP